MGHFITIIFISSLWSSCYSQREPTSISKFIMKSTFNPLLETIWRHEEMATRFIERVFNITILPEEIQDATNNDVIKFIDELKDGIANLKDLTLFISEKNDAKEVFYAIETALRTISDTFEKTVYAKGHFVNNTIERPSMYEHRFITALQTCVVNFDTLYNKIVDKKLLFQYALPGFSSSLKILEDVCKIEKSQNMELANVVGFVKTAVAQIYVTLNISSALADKFSKSNEVGSYAASFNIEWDNIRRKYKRLLEKLVSDMENSSCAYWSCKLPNIDGLSNLRKQQYYYINTQATVADWTNHSVVVGAKFELIDDTFYLQVQEGQLLPNGSINPETIKWDNRIRDPKNHVKIMKSDGWNDMKAFELTEVKLPQGHVVVGLEMSVTRAIGDTYRNRVGLVAYSAGFDFAKGEILMDDNVDIRRRPPVASEKLLLYKKKQTDAIFAKGNQYILIDENKEKNERKHEITSDKQTIPLLNTQEVIPKPSIPLSGVGLFLHRLSEFENIVGIKLFTYDVSPHVNTDVY